MQSATNVASAAEKLRMRRYKKWDTYSSFWIGCGLGSASNTVTGSPARAVLEGVDCGLSTIKAADVIVSHSTTWLV